MALTVDYKETDNKNDAYIAVKKAVTPELLAKFKVTAKIEYMDDLIVAKGKGFKLEMEFDDNSCFVKLDLSFLLKPLKSKVLEGIEKQLKRVV